MTTTWIPPGAGEWKRDDMHIASAVTRFLAELAFPSQQAGFARGFAYYGATLAGFDIQLIAGRVYLRPRIAGAPAQPIWGASPPKKIKGPGKPPPKLIFKLLFKLHPDLRRRAKRAAEVWRDQSWRAMTRNWYDVLRPAAVARNRELTRVDVAALDDTALAAHLETAIAAFREMFVHHFTHASMPTVVVGDFMARAVEWTGATPGEVLAVLQGASPASRAGADQCAKIATALATDSELRAIVESSRPAAEIMAALQAASGDVGREVAEYLDVHGLRPLSGMDIHHDLVRDMPEVTVRAIRAALRGEAAPENTGPALLAALRTRVHERERAAFDAAYAEARSVYGVRDDDVGITAWSLGLVHRTAREAARRLATRGVVEQALHAYDAGPDELLALLRGGATPSAVELRRRSEERAAFDLLDPPHVLGEGGPMPPLDSFPPAVARMQRGVMTFIEAMMGRDAAPASASTDPHPTVTGTGVSHAVYEGRARVVRSAADFDRIEHGDVLIARFTSPVYNVLLPLLGGIVTERGGLLSHAAIVAREYGLAAVVDARGVLTSIPDGARVRVDGRAGTVQVVRITDDAPAKTSVAKSAAPAKALPVEQPRTAGRVAPLRQASELEFGGKAKALAAALVARLPVPDGVALDADLVARVVQGEADARAIVTAAVANVPAPWAIRSSAVGEDSALASFAGQHATVLGVKPAELFEAIAAVHASGHTEAALAYRERMHVSGAPRMGIVVQTLLRPDISGVMFSRDPSAAAREGRLIEATWGLGEALVSGLVTPDRYRVASDGKVLERAIGEKDLAIEAQDGGGTAEVAIEGDRVRAACLDDAQIAELAQLASRCEQLFGGPQDLEWAVANGRLHLLQSRPVTTGTAS